MSQQRYQLVLSDYTEIHRLPDSWPDSALRQVLEKAEFDDPVSDPELLEMCLMVLQDLKPRRAALVVLEVVFGDRMRPGVRDNIAEELQQDRPWEDHAVIDQQRGLFESVVLLQQAFPTLFGTPDALQLTLDIRPADRDACGQLEQGLSAALLLRMLAAGMDEDATLRRLFDDALASTRFDEADAIVWHLNSSPMSAQGDLATFQCQIISSGQWLDALEEATTWTARAWPDDRRTR